jgi:methylenetetrahydrofolate reductase (NADPH)
LQVRDLLAGGLTRSFEYFPPKNDEESAVLEATLENLATLHPSFVSVTYRGGAASRQRTYDLVKSIQSAGATTAMAHLICVGHSREEMREILEDYLAAGVTNVMALGGDIPDDPSLVASDFAHALDLVTLAREVGDFSIGVAAHPFGHPRSPDLASDRYYLAEKLRVADFAVTQLLFSTAEWTSLVEDMAALDVVQPILPGIMPVTTLSSVRRMEAMGGHVPATLVARLEAADAAGGATAVRAEGIAAARELCAELLDLGVPGLHFYTLNRSTATREIYEALFDEQGARRV